MPGTISCYFWACFPQHVLNKWFNYFNDTFLELFKFDKFEFFNTLIIPKRNQILTDSKIQILIDKFEKSFQKYF